ncbi:hypothetical protein [Luteolibacter luteus]|uniref:PEGA domain-containing protein n=1 Tax=Luteolibacter luteus TaxID=2728835 RepID=A0A858RCX8_9BACT|nr:hypothetical protein [Luteolibacter luteus]QJE94464.1 hypothetical protein HHL09_01225 [Luteolibacter luteus]
MHFNPRLVSLVLAVLSITAPFSSKAAITPEQVATAVKSPEGVTWTVSQPQGQHWYIAADGLQLSDPNVQATHWIEASATGPGIVGLDFTNMTWVSQSALSVTVDGQLSEPSDPNAGGSARVEIGAGPHTIRWQLQRTVTVSSNQNPWMMISNASWMPYAVHPLETGLVSATGVTLSSPGTNPWIGQDGRHHGDGAAAWSGLKVRSSPSGIEGETPLRASFEGPGVLSFWQRIYGSGQVAFRFDNGSDQFSNPYEWTRTRLLVGPGAHKAEWRPSVYSGAGRASFDMAVDEIQLLPLVPYHEALGTLGIQWTATQEDPDAALPYGIPQPGASTGSIVTGFSYRTTLSTPVSGPSLLEFRFRGAQPDLILDASQTYHATTYQLPRPVIDGWLWCAAAIPADAQKLTIRGWESTELDELKFVSPPSTIAKSLGLPEGLLGMGGQDAHSVVALPEVDGFGAMIEVEHGQEEAWLELPVQGPAELRFFRKGFEALYFREVTIQIDGKEIEVPDRYVSEASSRIELPAGNHRVRWVVRPPASAARQPNRFYLAAPQITPLAPGAGALPALGLAQPLALPVGWSAVMDTGRESPILQAPPLAELPPDHQSHEFSTLFTGPGELSFWWHAGTPEDGDQRARWTFHNNRLNNASVTREPNAPAGWRQEKLWLLPGESAFSWIVSGDPEAVALTALDQVEFTPSPTASLGEATDAPSLPWETNTNLPWTGYIPGAPGEDIALSPSLSPNESSTLRTTVQGPGTLSFRWKYFGSDSVNGIFKVDGIQRTDDNIEGDRQESVILRPGPVELQWEVKCRSWGKANDSWIGVDEVVWTPLEPLPLTESLDAPATVKWKTSEAPGFQARTDPDAEGGSHAYAVVSDGEEAWLEATVHGPGLFDFWLLDIPGFHLWEDEIWNYWSLTIDGKPVFVSGRSWPAQWITGEGPHKIRLILKIPEGYGGQMGGAVDQVSWTPMASLPLAKAAGGAKLRWKTSSPQAVGGLKEIGREGAPAILIRSRDSETNWIQTTVKGPCEISWNSMAEMRSEAGDSRLSLTLNGREIAGFWEHEWQAMRLTLPAGNHVLRWKSTPWDDTGEPEDPRLAFDSTWLISGIQIKKGLSPLAQALDAPELFAFEEGDAGGRLIKIGKSDFWEPGVRSQLRIFTQVKEGRCSFRWGRPDGGCAEVWSSSVWGGGVTLASAQAGWQQHPFLLLPDSYLELEYRSVPLHAGNAGPPLLDTLVMDLRPESTLAKATESKSPLVSEGWGSVFSREAKVGKDHAISLLGSGGIGCTASTSIEGPASVSYWWKQSGPGTLRLQVNGILLPVPEVGTAWSKVEFRIPAGEAKVEWIHRFTGTNEAMDYSEAALDELVVKPAEDFALNSVAPLDPGLVLSEVKDSPERTPWHPVAYRGIDGSWTDAARAVSGGKKLQVSVHGPALLSFRARVFDGYPVVETDLPISPASVVIVNPPGPQPGSVLI